MDNITGDKHLPASTFYPALLPTGKENRTTSSANNSNNTKGPNLISNAQPHIIMPNNPGAHNNEPTRINSRQATVIPTGSESVYEEMNEQAAQLPRLPPLPPRPAKRPKASNFDAHSNDFHHSKTTRSSTPELARSGRSDKSWQNARLVQMQGLDRKHDSSSDSDSDDKDGTASNKLDTHIHQLYKQVTERRFDQSLDEYLDTVGVDLDNFNKRQYFFAKMQRNFTKACKVLRDGQCGQIVVCGFQSAGKSSLIAALTGAKTQITQGTATKQPIIYQFNNAEVFSAEIKTENGLPSSFKDMKSVNEHLAKTQGKIRGDLSAEILYVSINAPSFICRTLVDLPGDIRDDAGVAKIRDAMYARFMKPENVIVRVIPSTADYQTDARTYDLLTSGHKYPYKMLVNTYALNLWEKQLTEANEHSNPKEGWIHPLFSTGIYTPQKKHEQHKEEVTATPLFAIDAPMPALDQICTRPVGKDGNLNAISDVWDALDNDLMTSMKAKKGADNYRLAPGTIGFTPLNNTLNFIVDKIQSKALKNLRSDLKRQIKECHLKNKEYQDRTTYNLGVLRNLVDFYFNETKFANKQKLSNAHEKLKSDLNKYAFCLLGPVSALVRQDSMNPKNKPKQEDGTSNQMCLTDQPAAQSDDRTALDNSDNENAISSASAQDQELQRKITTQDRITFFTETIRPFLESSTVTLAEDNSGIRKNSTLVDMLNPVQQSVEKIHTKMYEEAKKRLNQHVQTIIRDTLFGQDLRDGLEDISIGENQLEEIFETCKAKAEEYLEGITECIKVKSPMIGNYKNSQLYLKTRNVYSLFCQEQFGGKFPKSLSVDALKCFAERNKSQLAFSAALAASVAGTGALISAAGPAIAVGGGIAAVGATALTGGAALKVVPKVGGGIAKRLKKSFIKAKEKDRERAEAQKKQKDSVKQVVSSVFDNASSNKAHTEMAVLFARIEYEICHDLKHTIHQITEPITTNLYSHVAKTLDEELRKVYSNRILKPDACPETPEFYYHENSVVLNQLKEIKSLAKGVW